MADLRDFTGKNRKFTGTIGERISPGTTVDRDVSFGQGTIRFNTTTNLMEYYDGTQWKPIDSPPTITSISPSTVASDGSTLFNVTVSGGNFSIGCTAKWIGNDGTQYTPSVVTRNSASSVTVKTTTAMTVANEPYDIQITNSSGLSATLENALDAGSTPSFTASAGSLGTLTNGNRDATALTSQTFGPALDADNQQINYTITSGSLPSGLRLGTPNDGNNGKILGTATAVVSDTTSNFTIQASDGVNTTSRAYSITVNAPVITSYTSTGAFTFSVPSGITSVDVLVVGGGGGGGNPSPAGGGGGAGGLIYRPGFPVTPAGSVPGSVGSGAAVNSTGQDSVFGSLTAKGGGAGVNNAPGGTGGSGGGSCTSADGGTNPGGPASQPSQPGDSGTYGFGNPGGVGQHYGGYWIAGGGGGGAGGTGGTVPRTTSSTSGAGGIGRQYDISGSNVYYAGGGGGGGTQNPSPATPGTGGQGGGGAGSNGTSQAQAGTANTGGGGGGAGHQGGAGNSGGSGIVIVKY